MIFEVRKGRECSATLTASLERITALENLTHSQSGLIELRGREVANLKELDQNWSDRLTNTQELYQIDKAKLKSKLRKARRNNVFAGGVIAVLLAVLFL